MALAKMPPSVVSKEFEKSLGILFDSLPAGLILN
jgi:hypothetical protein